MNKLHDGLNEEANRKMQGSMTLHGGKKTTPDGMQSINGSDVAGR
jgi:hypothetical protein